MKATQCKRAVLKGSCRTEGDRNRKAKLRDGLQNTALFPKGGRLQRGVTLAAGHVLMTGGDEKQILKEAIGLLASEPLLDLEAS
jgi:hypothetical protein